MLGKQIQSAKASSAAARYEYAYGKTSACHQVLYLFTGYVPAFGSDKSHDASAGGSKPPSGRTDWAAK
jgi:hypothetical protein